MGVLTVPDWEGIGTGPHTMGDQLWPILIGALKERAVHQFGTGISALLGERARLVFDVRCLLSTL